MDLAVLSAQEFSHRHFSGPLLQPQSHDADFSPYSPQKTFPMGMYKLMGALGKLL